MNTHMNRLSVCALAVVLSCSLSACEKSPTDADDEEPSPSYDESNRIAFNGGPLGLAGCQGVANTWTWILTVTENNGVDGMTIDYLDIKLDGVAQPRQVLGTALRASATVAIPRSACASTSGQHVVEESLVSTYKGRQSTFGNTITLLAK